MSEPYYPAKAGDPILAEQWNDMQRKARDEIRAHTHMGGDDGKQLDGRAISPGSTLTVKDLHATGSLKVNNEEVLSVKGGTLNGGLQVKGKLEVTGGAIVPVVGNAETAGILFPKDPGGGSGDLAFIRYYVVQGETTVLRMGIDNDGDDTLNLWQAGADRLILRDGNVEIPSPLRLGSGTFKNPAQVSIRASGHTGGMLAVEKADGYRMLHVDNNGEVSIDRLTVTTALTVKQNLTVTGVMTTGEQQVKGKLEVTGGAIVPVVGNAETAGIMFPKDPGGGGGDLAFIRYYVVQGETTVLRMGIDNDGDDTLNLWQAGADRLVIRDGNIGIGTSTPAVAMHIKQRSLSSGIRLESYKDSRWFGIHYDENNNVCLYHHNGRGQWMNQDGNWQYNSSDASLKQNVTPLQGSLDKVLRLRPVHFDWKSTGTRDLGLIAQEVEPLIPELVSETRQDGVSVKGVAYPALGVLAISALQELKRHYDERLATLERSLRELTAKASA